jgi:hypothetical protein
MNTLMMVLALVCAVASMALGWYGDKRCKRRLAMRAGAWALMLTAFLLLLIAHVYSSLDFLSLIL